MKLTFGFFFILLLPLWLFPSEYRPLLSNWDLLALWSATLVLHEMAHYLMWKALGYRTICRFKWHGPIQKPYKRAYTPLQSLLAALSGPCMSFTLAWGSERWIEPSAFQQTWVAMNWLWGIWQLFPIRKLDGWILLESSLQLAFGSRGIKLASFFSFVFCLAIAIAALLLAPALGFLLASCAVLLAFKALSHMRDSWQLGEADVELKIQPILLEAMELYKKGSKMTAELKLRELIEGPLQGRTITHARLLLAQWLLETGQAQNAWSLVKEIPKPDRLSGAWLTVMHQVAYQSENFDKVRQLAAKSFHEKPECSIAVMNAIACARIHKEQFNHPNLALKPYDVEKMVYEVVGWLQAAERLRFREWNVLLSSDFESLKGQAPFDDFLKKHR